MTNAPKAAIYTLGCRVNQYESRSIAERLASFGVEICAWGEVCDLYIVNTCAVTAQSGRKSRQMIRQAHHLNPNALILVTGCEAQLAQKALLDMDGVCYVCGNANKMSVADAARAILQGKTHAPCSFLPLDDYEPMHITASERTRAYVKIQDGCNGKCAYCIIPRLRGEVRSREMGDILAEIRTLAENGYREVVLTGIETSAYQYDLATLMEQVDAIDGIERIRLGSMDPSAMRPQFVDRIASLSHVMPHFHLSLQSGCDATLARMRRRYNTAQVKEAVCYMRKKMPNVQFTADIIVGFPGETEEEFDQTYRFLQSMRLSHIHLFPYSPRPMTEAAAMPDQISAEMKSARLAQLEGLVRQMKAQILAEEIGKTIPVLFEQQSDGYIYGHTENFLEVAVQSDVAHDNELWNVTLTDAKDGILYGNFAKRSEDA